MTGPPCSCSAHAAGRGRLAACLDSEAAAMRLVMACQVPNRGGISCRSAEAGNRRRRWRQCGVGKDACQVFADYRERLDITGFRPHPRSGATNALMLLGCCPKRRQEKTWSGRAECDDSVVRNHSHKFYCTFITQWQFRRRRAASQRMSRLPQKRQRSVLSRPKLRLQSW